VSLYSWPGKDDGGGEEDAAGVGAGVFVVAGGDATPLLEPAEAALDGVALLVAFGVELRRPPTRPSFLFPAFDLVTAFGNGVAEAAAAQLAPGGGMGAGPVGQQVRGPVAGLGEGIQQWHQARVVTGLPG
jgi:hypothetical protein